MTSIRVFMNYYTPWKVLEALWPARADGRSSPLVLATFTSFKESMSSKPKLPVDAIYNHFLSWIKAKKSKQSMKVSRTAEATSEVQRHHLPC